MANKDVNLKHSNFLDKLSELLMQRGVQANDLVSTYENMKKSVLYVRGKVVYSRIKNLVEARDFYDNPYQCWKIAIGDPELVPVNGTPSPTEQVLYQAMMDVMSTDATERSNGKYQKSIWFERREKTAKGKDMQPFVILDASNQLDPVWGPDLKGELASDQDITLVLTFDQYQSGGKHPQIGYKLYAQQIMVPDLANIQYFGGNQMTRPVGYTGKMPEPYQAHRDRNNDAAQQGVPFGQGNQSDGFNQQGNNFGQANDSQQGNGFNQQGNSFAQQGGQQGNPFGQVSSSFGEQGASSAPGFNEDPNGRF